jgi:hypothetical protein
MTIDPDDLVQIVITVICSVVASSGFWAWLMKRSEKDDAQVQLLRGIAHNMIIDSGMTYIKRGWISKDEYADFEKYLYEPYEKTGGNGLAHRVYMEVQKLPIRDARSPEDIVIEQKKKERNGGY